LNITNLEKVISLKEEEIKEDIRKYEPTLEAARETLQSFPKKAIIEFKNFSKPPDGISDAVRAVLLFLTNGDKIKAI
jgi:hypothetical protein